MAENIQDGYSEDDEKYKKQVKVYGDKK